MFFGRPCHASRGHSTILTKLLPPQICSPSTGTCSLPSHMDRIAKIADCVHHTHDDYNQFHQTEYLHGDGLWRQPPSAWNLLRQCTGVHCLRWLERLLTAHEAVAGTLVLEAPEPDAGGEEHCEQQREDGAPRDHVCSTPGLNFGMSAFSAQASSVVINPCLVVAGSMMASTQSLAAA